MVGKTIAHYNVTAKLGAGGMGEVYRAHDEQLDRDVALKVLPASSFADPAARARLLREARSAASLNHPNICTIHEVGEAEGQAYIAMELVEGRPLSELVKDEALPAESVLRYGIQVAEALSHAHERGIVHRDLKSGNVVVTAEGRAKVLDFGLAKKLGEGELDEATRSQVSLTQPGAIVGTLAYMAPEQLRGEPADARSDIWALGVVLYETAAGTRPFQGQTGFALSTAIMSRTPPALPGKVPVEVRAVIERCLAKDPGQRYQRAGEVRAALEAIQTGSAAPWTALQYHFARRRWKVLAVTGIVLLAAMAALNLERLRTRFSGGAPRIESLAVLPLKDLTGDHEQKYFVQGMHEALITELSKISALKVISRNSALRYEQTDKRIPQVASELGVDGVIEGSVMREGEKVRITVQLLHGPSDRHVWAQSFDRELRGILALHSEVARAIATQISVKLTPQEQAKFVAARPVDPQVYELYLRGRYLWNQRTPESLQKGLEYFRQAIAKDPDYAPAHAGLADTYLTQYDYGMLPDKDSTPKARAAAREALALDPQLAEAHNSLAHIHLHEWAWTEAEQEFKRAIELDPGYTLAYHWYALCLTAMGRVDEAVAAMEKAQQLDPLSLRINADLGMAYLAARQAQQAIVQETKTLELDPNAGVAYWIRGMAYEQKEQHDQAIRDFQEALNRAPGNFNYMAALAHAHAEAGRPQEARKLLAQMKRGSKKAQPFFLALVYTGLREDSLALDALEQAYQDHSGSMRYLKVEPRLDPLRGHPRFQDLLRRMNFKE